MAAGAVWARGGPGDPREAEADAALLGLTLDDPDPDDGFEVWAWHEAALRAFLAIAGQWRVAGGGMGKLVWLGLDYAAAGKGLDLAGIAVTPEVWGQVRQIEAGAAKELNGSD